MLKLTAGWDNEGCLIVSSVINTYNRAAAAYVEDHCNTLLVHDDNEEWQMVVTYAIRRDGRVDLVVTLVLDQGQGVRSSSTTVQYDDAPEALATAVASMTTTWR